MYTIKLINSGWSIEIKRPSDKSYYKILQLIMTELTHWGNPVKDVPDYTNNTVYDLTRRFTLKEFHEFCKSLKEVVTPVYGFIERTFRNARGKKFTPKISNSEVSSIFTLPGLEFRVTKSKVQVFIDDLDFGYEVLQELKNERDDLIYWFNNMR